MNEPAPPSSLLEVFGVFGGVAILLFFLVLAVLTILLPIFVYKISRTTAQLRETVDWIAQHLDETGRHR